MTLSEVRKKWQTHRTHAIRRNVLPLSIEEYAQKLVDAGIQPNQVGRTHGSYQLARYTDSGDYTVASCRFITQVENLKERDANGGQERGSAKKRGKTKFDTPWLAARAAAFTGRTAETHEHVARMAATKSLPYHFVHESGEIMKGSNLRKFCRENDMEGKRPSFDKLRRGRLKSYKGWKNAPQTEA